jgi:hypothetical protein
MVRKPHFLLFLLLISALLLAACGGGDDDDEDTPVPTTPPTVEAEASPVAPAAVETSYPCFNLPEADCDVITAASDQTGEATSFSQTFTLVLAADGLEPLGLFLDNLPAGIDLSIEGGGPMVFTTGTEPPFALAWDMQVEGSIDRGSGEQAISGLLPVTVLDGMVYMPLTGEDGTAQMTGFPQAALWSAEVPLIGGTLGDLPIPEAMIMSATNLGSLLDIDTIVERAGLLGSGLGSTIDYMRLDSVELMDQTMYPFQMTVDGAAVIASDALPTLAAALFPDGSSFASVIPLLPLIQDGVTSTAVLTQYVGADDNYIHRLTLDISLTVDLSAILGSPGGTPSAADEVTPVTLNFAFDVQITDYNAEFTVTAPEDAAMMTLEEATERLGPEGAAPTEETEEAEG